MAGVANKEDEDCFNRVPCTRIEERHNMCRAVHTRKGQTKRRLDIRVTNRIDLIHSGAVVLDNRATVAINMMSSTAKTSSLKSRYAPSVQKRGTTRKGMMTCCPNRRLDNSHKAVASRDTCLIPSSRKPQPVRPLICGCTLQGKIGSSITALDRDIKRAS